ncbi:sensor histidine kinase [Seleniivibrio woodruffii]|uniref:sensor histidine kinase n=1 Tax=Seleniivibrio woodruffii TaxID=1078050 RepID=UPI00240A03B8|nr:ATP-binding protein [Seleniivibrio woodruffii]
MRQPLNPDLAQNLKHMLTTCSEWLVKRVTYYLKAQCYDVYLPDSDKWLSNALYQLNEPVLETPVAYFAIPELHPHADFSCDPYAQFGMSQARLFMRRRLDVVIFMGIFKYIRQSYEDLINSRCTSEEECRLCRSFMKRYFDHVELGFMNEYRESITRTKVESIPYKIVADKGGCPCTIFSPEGTCVYANSASARFMDTEGMHDILSRESSAFFHSGRQNSVYAFALSGRVYVAEFTLLTKESDRFSGALAVLRDETEKRNAKEILEESESFRSALMDGIAGAVLVLNMESLSIEDYNKKAAELLPFLTGAEDALEPVFHDDSGSKPMGLFELAEKTGSNEERLMETHGGMMPIRVFSVEVWLRNQRHRLLLMFDITREKMLERKLGHVQHLQSVGELALGLPIRMSKTSAEITGTLKSAIQALKDCPNRCGAIAANDLLPHVVDAENSLNDLTALLDALASITRSDSMEKEYINIDETVKSCVLLTRDKWEAYCEMELNLAKQQCAVRCYPDEMGQLVLNLLMNAAYAVRKKAEADGEKGKISVSTRYTADFFELRISDTGIGIKKHDFKRVFDAGFSTMAVGMGTGHGLSTVYDIVVNRYKGTIEFKSQEGVGTEFTVRLPLR